MHSNNTLNPLTKIDTAADLKRDLASGLDKFAFEWSQRLVRAIDHDPKIIQQLVDLNMDRGFLRRMEFLGRGQIDRRLLYATSAAATRLLRAPISEQASALEKGILVLDENETDERNIFPDDLTPEQVRQVFDRNGRIRSITEQRTVIRQRKQRLLPAKGDLNYRVHRDHIITLSADGAVTGRWSRKLIHQWLTEMG